MKKKSSKKKGGRTRGKRHDWPKLREEYIRAERADGREVSLEEYAKEKGITPSVLRAQAAKEEWREKRRQYRDRILTLARDKAVEKMAQEAVEQDSKDFQLATGIIELGNENVEIIKQADKGARPADLEKMAKAGESAQRMHRIAAGRSLPSEGGQQVNVNVHQSGVDPMDRIRRKFAACKDAGMDVEEAALDFCQMVIDDLLGPDYVVELKRRKALKGKQ